MAAIGLAQALRIQAHANRLANLRLAQAMQPLDAAEWQAVRTAFFPSLAQTLNHILMVDGYYIAALAADPALDEHWWSRFVPAADRAAWAAAQAASDERLVALCNRLDAERCAAVISMPRRGGRMQRDAAAHVLAHLFMHQTHHRGQVHAMLCGTRVAPPQLDEFLLPSEAHLRTAEMQALGWNEAAVYGAAR